jgi:hypothetical protein
VFLDARSDDKAEQEQLPDEHHRNRHLHDDHLFATSRHLLYPLGTRLTRVQSVEVHQLVPTERIRPMDPDRSADLPPIGPGGLA